MESKTKHRILGVVVVAGLAVLAFPFFQGKSPTSNEQALVKAPPFPDQAVQVASTDEVASLQPQQDTTTTGIQPQQDTSTTPVQPQQDMSTTPVQPQRDTATTPAQPPQDTNTTPVQPQQDTTTTPVQPQQSSQLTTPDAGMTPSASAATPAADKLSSSSSFDVNNNGGVEPAKAQVADNTRTHVADVPAPVKSSRHKKLAKVHTKDQPVIMSKLTTASAIKANRQQPLDNNGLLQLKKSAWVIQLGSFKQKSNALRLVNRLRAKGYRAFIQHVASSSGQNTRVFVGPEHQQTSARLVATELEDNLKLHGIVISYKPFSL